MRPFEEKLNQTKRMIIIKFEIKNDKFGTRFKVLQRGKQGDDPELGGRKYRGGNVGIQ